MGYGQIQKLNFLLLFKKKNYLFIFNIILMNSSRLKTCTLYMFDKSRRTRALTILFCNVAVHFADEN